MDLVWTYGREIRETLHLAGPVVAGMLAQNSMGFIDTIMVGRLGSGPLAAVALGNTIFYFIALVCMGIVMAVGPMVSHAYGAGAHEPIERSVRQGLWLALLLTIPAFAIVWNIVPFLRLTGQAEETIRGTQAYLRAVSWGFLPMLWFTALRSFVEGLSRPLPVTVITFLAAGLNVVGDYVLIYGKLGMPRMGLVGSGVATAGVLWFMFLALAVYTRRYPALRVYRIFDHFRRPDRTYFRELFRIGWPIGVSYGLESGLFSITAVMIGSLSTVALAAHQIALQSAAFTFMVPLGIGIATSIRVGQAAGRGEALAVQRAGYAGMVLAVVFMTCSAILFWTVPEAVVGLYMDVRDPANAGVVQIAVTLLGVAAVFQVFDGLQVSAGGSLRGLRDTRVPMMIGFLAYWVLGLSAGYVLGFVLGRGAVGLWWGLVFGLASAAVMLTWRFRRLSGRVAAMSDG